MIKTTANGNFCRCVRSNIIVFLTMAFVCVPQFVHALECSCVSITKDVAYAQLCQDNSNINKDYCATVQEVKRFQLGIEPSAIAVDSIGNIVVADDSGKIVCVNTEGDRLWSYESSVEERYPEYKYITCSEGGRIYCLSEHSIVCMDCNGVEKWVHVYENAITTNLVTLKNSVYFGTDNCSLCSYSKEGIIRWQRFVPAKMRGNCLQIVNKSTILITCSKNVYCVYNEYGIPLWMYDVIYPVQNIEYNDNSAVYYYCFLSEYSFFSQDLWMPSYVSNDNQIYTMGDRGLLINVKLMDNLEWISVLHGCLATGPMLIGNEYIYICGEYHDIYRINKKGLCKGAHITEDRVTCLVECNEKILYGCENGTLYETDGYNGRHIVSNIGDDMVINIVRGKEGKLYAFSADGVVLIVNTVRR